MQDMFLYIRNESWQRTGATPYPLHPNPLELTNKKMARPKKPDDQRREITRLVRFTKTEDHALAKRAKLAGMNASEFLREASLKRRFTPRIPLAEAEFLLFLRGEIGSVGNNLNQMVQRLNSSNPDFTASGFQELINQLQEINNEVLHLLRHGYSREKQR